MMLKHLYLKRLSVLDSSKSQLCLALTPMPPFKSVFFKSALLPGFKIETICLKKKKNLIVYLPGFHRKIVLGPFTGRVEKTDIRLDVFIAH